MTRISYLTKTNRTATNRTATTLVAKALVVAAIFAGVLAMAAPASANTKPDAIVSLGDSFISGEGGRWDGNSNDGLDPDRDHTDRAHRSSGWWSWWYDYDAVYPGGTYANGCNRSDVAEIHSAGVNATSINLACSGAVAANVIRAQNGGQTFKGEAPQADQLVGVVANYDVEMIVLSIGGNDLGFADVLTACALAWTTNQGPCNTAQQANIDADMATAMASVGAAIDDINAVLAEGGDTDYRFVLQSYPSPIPRGSDNRYSENGWKRLNKGGCPFWNADSDWARDTLVSQIDANLAAVAAAKGIEFLSMADAFEGKEACADESKLVRGDWDTPSSAKHEWVRFLVSGAVQGQLQESLHPNAFGQEALGDCLGQVYNAAPGNYACTNTGGSSTDMVISGL